jgi:hypothetical protein
VIYNRIGNDNLEAFNIKPLKLADESGPMYGDKCCFDPGVYTAPRGVSFVGCWQTEKFFDQEMVRRELSLKGRLSDKSQAVADVIMQAGEASAFLHVRRGDYVLDHNVKFHGMPTMRYYNEAVERIRAQHKNACFFVFSDDPGWCRANFPSDFTVVGHNTTDRSFPGTEYEDTHLMSLCHHGAMANSSFSWWGAWLGTQPNKMIFAPSRWFTNAQVEAAAVDTVPERWTRLEN